VELAAAAAGDGGGAKRWMRLSINETELEFLEWPMSLVAGAVRTINAEGNGMVALGTTCARVR
jgi:hypothetical protein